jgi:hypothetical protein
MSGYKEKEDIKIKNITSTGTIMFATIGMDQLEIVDLKEIIENKKEEKTTE